MVLIIYIWCIFDEKELSLDNYIRCHIKQYF